MYPNLPEGATLYVEHSRYEERAVRRSLATLGLRPGEKPSRDQAREIAEHLALHKLSTLRKHEQRPSPRGGLTKVTITLADGEELTGTAECSVADNFNASLGILIATGRALHEAGLGRRQPKERRAA